MTTREFELCVTSNLGNLAQIAEFVSELAASWGLHEDDVFAVQMAVDEACTNSIEHAYGGRDDGQVHVCCYVEDDQFVVRITDFGESFDPSSVSSPDVNAPLEEREIGGLGLFFMRKLMDSVEFLSSGSGNQVIMRKRRAGSPA
jgi:serine/threonine-protein kinase RsbW